MEHRRREYALELARHENLGKRSAVPVSECIDINRLSRAWDYAAKVVRLHGPVYLPIFEQFDRELAQREKCVTTARRTNDVIAEELRKVRFIGAGGTIVRNYICRLLNKRIDRRGRPRREIEHRRNWAELCATLPGEIRACDHPKKEELATWLRGEALVGGCLSPNFDNGELFELLICAARVLDGSINRRGRLRGKYSPTAYVTLETAKKNTGARRVNPTALRFITSNPLNSLGCESPSSTASGGLSL